MKYFLDSASIKDIEKWINVIEGVTVNPILLKENGLTIIEFLNKTKDYKIKKFIPIYNINEFKEIYNLGYEHIIYKVSMYPKYYDLIRSIKEKNMQVAATTVYDLIQLNQAIEMSCEYSMVYIAKNENENFLQEASLLTSGVTKLVGASFRTKNQVKDVIKAGLSYSTIRSEILEKVFTNAQVEEEIKLMQK